MSNTKTNNNKTEDLTANIKVVCRFRPLNNSEKQHKLIDIQYNDDDQIVLRKNNDGEKITFKFDKIFKSNCNQKEVYEISGKNVIQSVLQGFNGTIFAYGQTSSGKTYTMTGSQNEAGIIPRMIETIFNHIDESDEEVEFMIKVQIVEIYNEKIRDLLDISKTDLKVREDKLRGIYIQDATEQYVNDEQDIELLLCQGSNNRAVGATNMNEGSSRSHMLFILEIKQKDVDLSIKVGRLFLVDLAGSEKISKTGAEGQQLVEAKSNVISALTEHSTHIPYRNSKLTRICQDSLGGNSKTTLIITCSPSLFNEAETISTLRFGLMAKKIKNQPKINRELTIEQLQSMLNNQISFNSQLQSQITYLQNLLSTNNIQYNHSNNNNNNNNNINQNLDHNHNHDQDNKQNNNISNAHHIDQSKINQYEEQIISYQKDLESKNEQQKIIQKKYTDLKLKYAKQAAQLLVYQKQNEILVNKLAQTSLKLEQDDNIINEKQIFINGYQQSLIQKEQTIKQLREQNQQLLQNQKNNNQKLIADLQDQMQILNPVIDYSEQLKFFNECLHYEFQRSYEKEKQKNSLIEAKYQQLENNFKELIKEKITNYDQIYKQIIDIIQQKNNLKTDQLQKVEVQRQIINDKLSKRYENLKEVQIKLTDTLQNNQNIKQEFIDKQIENIKKTLELEDKLQELEGQNNQILGQNNELICGQQIQEQRLEKKGETIRQLEEKVLDLSSKYYELKIKNEQMKNMMTQNELGTQIYAQVINDQEDSQQQQDQEWSQQQKQEQEKLQDYSNYVSRNVDSNNNFTRRKIIANIKGGRSNNLLYSQQLAISMQRNYYNINNDTAVKPIIEENHD